MAAPVAAAAPAAAGFMAKFGPAIIGAGSSLLGGILSSRGASKRNEEQLAAAREQIAFQERMSNTQFQRATADLRKAGLNPILAAGAQASSPGGAMPTLENEIAPGVNSAVQLMNMVMQAQLTRQQIRKTKADSIGVEQTNNIRKPASDAGQVLGEITEKGKGTVEQLKDVSRAPIAKARQVTSDRIETLIDADYANMLQMAGEQINSGLKLMKQKAGEAWKKWKPWK